MGWVFPGTPSGPAPPTSRVEHDRPARLAPAGRRVVPHFVIFATLGQTASALVTVPALSLSNMAWAVEGIEFRSVTVVAYKGKEGPCFDQKHAVVYRGPFREVVDDDGHVLRRGVRAAVCEKTYRILSQEPYRSRFELIPPCVIVPLEHAPAFPMQRGRTAARSLRIQRS